MKSKTLHTSVSDKPMQSGHAGEFHPCVPTEPYVNLSIHTALPVQSQMYKNIMDIPIPNGQKVADSPDTFYEAS